MTAAEIIDRLALGPHPEGGWFRETFRHQPDDGSRGAATHIYYLLQTGERSAWHRLDAVEIWHFYAGASLLLSLSGDAGPARTVTLGANLVAGESFHAVVPASVWQSAQSKGAWSLVGCTVAPAFAFRGFELAPDGWTLPFAR